MVSSIIIRAGDKPSVTIVNADGTEQRYDSRNAHTIKAVLQIAEHSVSKKEVETLASQSLKAAEEAVQALTGADKKAALLEVRKTSTKAAHLQRARSILIGRKVKEVAASELKLRTDRIVSAMMKVIEKEL